MASRTVTTLTAVLQMNNTKFKKGLSGSQKALKGFQGQLKKIGAMVAGAFAVRAVINFGKSAFQALDTQRKAEANLITALKGKRDIQQNLIKQAQELQKLTLFGDEETIRAQALIAAFVREEETIRRIIPLVQDMATAKGMDLAGAADLVAKTLGSSTNALSRYGIEVTGAVGSSERLATLVDGLSTAFEGQAIAAAKADTSLTQLKNTWGDIKEKLAGDVLDKVTEQGEYFAAIGKIIDAEGISGWKKMWATLGLMKEDKIYALAKSIDALNKSGATFSELNFGKEPSITDPLSLLPPGFVPKGPDGGKPKVPIKLPKIAEADSFMKQFQLGHASLGEIPQMNSNFLEHKLKQGLDTAKWWESKLPDINLGLATTNDLLKNFDEYIDDVADGFEDALGDETFDNVNKVGEGLKGVNSTIALVVTSFSGMGSTIAEALSGVEGSLAKLGQTILENAGSILMMAGLQSGNIPLVVAGAALQLGTGIWKYFSNKNVDSSITPAGLGGNHSIQFQIEGRDLMGAIDRNQTYDNMR